MRIDRKSAEMRRATDNPASFEPRPPLIMPKSSGVGLLTPFSKRRVELEAQTLKATDGSHDGGFGRDGSDDDERLGSGGQHVQRPLPRGLGRRCMH